MNYNFVKHKNLVIMDPFLNLKHEVVELLTIETSSQLLRYKNKAWITFYTCFKVVFRIKITTIAPIFLSNIKEDNEVKRYIYISTELIELHFYDTKKPHKTAFNFGWWTILFVTNTFSVRIKPNLKRRSVIMNFV